MKKGKAEKQFKSILRDSGKAHFDTANGRTASMDRVGVFIEQMPIQIKPWLLDHTPLVLKWANDACRMDLILCGSVLNCHIS